MGSFMGSRYQLIFHTRTWAQVIFYTVYCDVAHAARNSHIVRRIVSIFWNFIYLQENNNYRHRSSMLISFTIPLG